MIVEGRELFDRRFLDTLRSLVDSHHSIYPLIPPQGIFFESLVAQAFTRSGWPSDEVTLSAASTPQHDLLVGVIRISLKTETGIGTDPERISITKLCTTETGTWDSGALIQHALAHLDRYDAMLMLRAVWRVGSFHYQLLEIPLVLLRLIAGVEASPVGRRQGRRSMAVDVCDQEGKVFRVHFDGADGKCQIRGLSVSRCRVLLEWDQAIG